MIKSIILASALLLSAGPAFAVSCSSDDGNENCDCAVKCDKSANQCWCVDSFGKKVNSYSTKIEKPNK